MTSAPTELPEFDVELIQRLVTIAKNLPIKPFTDDRGHQFYFFRSERERMIQALSEGWTYEAHVARSGDYCYYSPCHISELGQDRDFDCAYVLI